MLLKVKRIRVLKSCSNSTTFFEQTQVDISLKIMYNNSKLKEAERA